MQVIYDYRRNISKAVCGLKQTSPLWYLSRLKHSQRWGLLQVLLRPGLFSCILILVTLWLSVIWIGPITLRTGGGISMNEQSCHQPTQSSMVHVCMATIRHTIIMGWKSLAHEKGASDFVIFTSHAFSFIFQKYILYICTVHICSGVRQITYKRRKEEERN